MTKKPIYSMTGFARIARGLAGQAGFTLTLKSVNHRFLDLHLRLPSGTDALEMRLRRALKEKIARGHIELTLTLERAARTGGGYDAVLLAGYVAAFREAAQEHGLSGEPDLNALLRLPGVFNGVERMRDEELAGLDDAAMGELDTLIAAMNTMRAQEGDALVAVLEAELARLASSVEEVAALRGDVQRAYFERVAERIAVMTGGGFDRERVLQEAAMIAERSDIEEETARLRAHIEHFRTLLVAGGEVGKKLDFLLQEMNREANTLLSKTGGVAGNGPKVTELGLGMKSAIEKMREQVQNLE